MQRSSQALLIGLVTAIFCALPVFAADFDPRFAGTWTAHITYMGGSWDMWEQIDASGDYHIVYTGYPAHPDEFGKFSGANGKWSKQSTAGADGGTYKIEDANQLTCYSSRFKMTVTWHRLGNAPGQATHKREASSPLVADSAIKTEPEHPLARRGADQVAIDKPEHSKKEIALSRNVRVVSDSNPPPSAHALGKNYALFIASDKYDSFPSLLNPVIDASALEAELTEHYGFHCEHLLNGSKKDIEKKLRQYCSKTYGPGDELLVFFAGHGLYDDKIGMGFLVTKDSQDADETRDSFIAFPILRDMLDNVPCQHVMVCLDVCHAGTFDKFVAKSCQASRGTPTIAANFQSMLDECLGYKSRKLLCASISKSVSDGLPGQHSPFANALLEALRTTGRTNGYVTFWDLAQPLKKLNPIPLTGDFGSSEPGSDFFFVHSTQ